jgi:hypothetical protein
MRRRDIVAFFGVAAALAGTLAGEIARAQHDTISTAQYIMPDCRAFVGPALHRGRCCGIVEGLVFAGKGVALLRHQRLSKPYRLLCNTSKTGPEFYCAGS